MLYRMSTCKCTRAFSRSRFFSFGVPQRERPVTRGTRHCTSRYIDPLPFQLIGGFPRGAFDDQPSAAAATVTPSPPLHHPHSTARRLRHGPRTDVTDSTSVKKANTKPISALSTTSAPVHARSLPVFPPSYSAVDSSNKRLLSLYSLGLCRAHVVLLLRLPYDLVPVHQSSFPICPCKDRFVKPERKTARYLQTTNAGEKEGGRLLPPLCRNKTARKSVP